MKEIIKTVAIIATIVIILGLLVFTVLVFFLSPSAEEQKFIGRWATSDSMNTYTFSSNPFSNKVGYHHLIVSFVSDWRVDNEILYMGDVGGGGTETGYHYHFEGNDILVIENVNIVIENMNIVQDVPLYRQE